MHGKGTSVFSNFAVPSLALVLVLPPSRTTTLLCHVTSRSPRPFTNPSSPPIERNKHKHTATHVETQLL